MEESQLGESNEVEKNFVVLQETEYKKRERHCSMQALSDILRICTEVPESIDMLVTRAVRGDGSSEFSPKKLIQKAQEIYADHWGERNLQARRSESQQETKSKTSIRMPSEAKARPSTQKISLKERKGAWIHGAKQMQDDSRVLASQMLNG